MPETIIVVLRVKRGRDCSHEDVVARSLEFVDLTLCAFPDQEPDSDGFTLRDPAIYGSFQDLASDVEEGEITVS